MKSHNTKHPAHALFESDNIGTGTLVEVVLREQVALNLATTTVPTYHADATAPAAARACTGYVCELTNDYLSLLPVWDKTKNKHPDQGHVGGININWDAVKTYRRL